MLVPSRLDSNSALDTFHWSAVKTGTSRDMTDNWCIGFSGDYVVGVWVGNLTGEPMWNVSGVETVLAQSGAPL